MALINLNDYEKKAQTSMPPAHFDYYQGGSDDEVTLQANRTAYQRLQLRPRVLVDVANLNTATSVLNTPIKVPILIAPSSVHKLAHSDGELATANAAKSHDTIMVVSTLSTYSIEEIARTNCKLWFQLYIYRNQKLTESLIKRAETAGYKALVLTVDTARYGRRERDLRNNFKLPAEIQLANFVGGPYSGKLGDEREPITWKALAWLRSKTSLPIILKGILTAEDALLAVEHRVDGIVVSNHGGRQLDSVVSTIEALPEVVAAIDGKCEVYIDGGIRRGTDVLKAIALGAKAVLVGRPVLWGLGVDGEKGVTNVIGLLASELELAMALTGRPTIESIDRGVIRLEGFRPSIF